MLLSYYHTSDILSEHWGQGRRNHNHGKLEYPTNSVFLYYSLIYLWFKCNMQGLEHIFWTWSSEEFSKASWPQWLFAMKAAKLPTHCKATEDTEMDDLGSVIQVFYVTILVMKQRKRKITTTQYQHMTKLCTHILNEFIKKLDTCQRRFEKFIL